MQALEIRISGEEATTNEKSAPSIDSSVIDTNENAPFPDDERSEEDESEASMKRRSSIANLTSVVCQCLFPVPRPSLSIRTKFQCVGREFSHDMSHDVLEKDKEEAEN